MPSPDIFSSSANQTFSHHWYTRLLSRPARRRRYSSFVLNNIWNATSNWDNALQGNPAGLLATMRVQVDNLKQVIDASGLDNSQKPFLQRLIVEAKQALDSLNPVSQQANRTSSNSSPMRRLANEESAISSNAKAALGCMAYLQDDQLFPGCSGIYQYVRERLEQIYRLMDGEYQIADVVGIRQQQMAPTTQQFTPMFLNPDGSMTPYTPPSAGTSLVHVSAAVCSTGSRVCTCADGARRLGGGAD